MRPQSQVPFLALCGCDDVVNKNTRPDYSVEQELGCFCPRGGVRERVFVKADTVTEAYAVSNYSRLRYAELQGYKSIKGLFEVIAGIDTSVYALRVEMDSSQNFPPTSISIRSPWSNWMLLKPELGGRTLVAEGVAYFGFSEIAVRSSP